MSIEYLGLEPSQIEVMYTCAYTKTHQDTWITKNFVRLIISILRMILIMTQQVMNLDMSVVKYTLIYNKKSFLFRYVLSGIHFSTVRLISQFHYILLCKIPENTHTLDIETNNSNQQ